MKTSNVVIGLISLAVGVSSYAQSAGSHGGGGVVRNGEYLTFKSAGVELKVGVTKLNANQIPGLADLSTDIGGLTLISAEKDNLYNAYYPAGSRRYFIVPTISPELRKELVHSYSEAIQNQVPAANLAPYAFTLNHETYLLPEFFKLTGKNGISDTQAKEVILFQEMLWALTPQMNERFATRGQITFETFLLNHKDHTEFDSDFYRLLGLALNDASVALVASARTDFKSGRLQQFLLQDQSLLVRTVFGSDWLTQGGAFVSETFNTVAWKRNLLSLIQQNPSILMFGEFLNLTDILSRGPSGYGSSTNGDAFFNLISLHLCFDFIKHDPTPLLFSEGWTLPVKVTSDASTDAGIHAEDGFRFLFPNDRLNNL